MGDSGYEILTDSIILTDEEDEASSVASIDDDDMLENDDSGSMADSIASLFSRPEEEEEEGHDPDPIPTFGGLDDQHLNCSGITARNRSGSCTPDEEIILDEPVDFDGDYIAVSRKLTDFSELETTELWRHLGGKDDTSAPALYSTIRQCMSRELLEADEPFRVLYIGSPAAKEEIQHKLAAALAAAISESASSSGSWDGVKSPRFNIVPITSFGSRSNTPDVELVNSTGLDMTFDVCSAAKATKNEGRPETLSLWLNGNQNITSVYGERGAQLESAGWKLPHLAVIYCSDDDNTQHRMTRFHARMFVASHAVATLLITQSPLYHNATENFSLDPRSIHLCIESDARGKGEDGDTRGSVIHKTLPIDLSTFLNLNLRQLNRSLGCITRLSFSNPNQHDYASQMMQRQLSMGAESATTSLLLRDVEKAPQDSEKFGGRGRGSLQWIRKMGTHELWKLVLVSWVVFCGIAGGIFGIAYMKVANYTADEVSVLPETPTMISVATPCIALQHTSTSSDVSMPPISVTVSSPVAVMSVPAAPAVDFWSQLVMAFNSSDRFQIDIVGHSHVVVRPPQKYLLLRRPPPLFVRVTRNQDNVDASLSKLNDGSYTLNIDEDDAWGVLKVALWTKSKPIVEGDLEVDFGTPWMKMSRWMKAVEERRAELQLLLDQAAIDAKEIATDFSQTAGHQAAEMGSIVLTTAKEYSDVFSSGLVKLYQEAMALTTNFKASSSEHSQKYVRKAQGQAKTIWEHRRNGNEAGMA